MKLPPLHPFSRRYLLPGESPKTSLERLIISLDPGINLQSLFDGSITSAGGKNGEDPQTESPVFDDLAKRWSLARLVKKIEDWPSWAEDTDLGDTGFRNDDDECVVQDQPDYEFHDLESIVRELDRIQEEQSRQEKEPPRKESPKKDKCKDWRMETLAWYCPAHIFPIKDYGIHIRKNGVAKIVKIIEEIIKSNRHQSQDKRILIFAVIFQFYAHELCHAWVEDLCSLIDFIYEENDPDRSKRRYARTLDRMNSYIFLEEDICNTAAYGLLQHQLRTIHTIKDQGFPAAIADFDPDVILKAFEQWMRNYQPKGYRNFASIAEKPQSSSLFRKKMLLLLQHPKIYGYPLDRLILEDIIDGFIADPSDTSLDLVGWFTGHKYTPPVYLEWRNEENGRDEYPILDLLDKEERDIFHGVF